MPRKVTPGPRGLWKLVVRVQRFGFAQGLRGKGGHWLALGVGAWGLQRLRAMSVKDAEILIKEPLAPGERIVITNETITRAAEDEGRRRAGKAAKAAARASRRS
ncbi:MAG TPA: hypothetical protein VEW93_12510 [Acidimicrobiales bacterium]|nr:hypothetical protein [Acidimicrobiales bacterium]